MLSSGSYSAVYKKERKESTLRLPCKIERPVQTSLTAAALYAERIFFRKGKRKGSHFSRQCSEGTAMFAKVK